jgi:hypothetical protein
MNCTFLLKRPYEESYFRLRGLVRMGAGQTVSCLCIGAGFCPACQAHHSPNHTPSAEFSLCVFPMHWFAHIWGYGVDVEGFPEITMV